MGGLNPGIPLSVRIPSEPEGPMQMQQGAMQLSALAQQQQLRNQQLQTGEIQLQQARQNQLSQQMLQQIYQKNQGDLDATYKEAAASGKVVPDHLFALQKHNLDMQTQVATLSKDKLAEEIASGNEFMGILTTAKTLPPDQRMGYVKSQVSQRATRMDMSGAAKILSGLPDLKDKTIDGLSPTLIGYNKYVEQEHQKLDDAAKVLTAKAAMTKAETEKLPTETSLALASAQGDKTAEAALKRLDQSKLASRPPADPLTHELALRRLEDSEQRMKDAKQAKEEAKNEFHPAIAQAVVQGMSVQASTRRLLGILEPYKNQNQSFSSFLKTMEYKFGKAQADAIGSELASINLTSLQQAGSVLKGMGGVRSQTVLHEVMQHTPNPLKDSTMNMYEKMKNIDRATSTFLTEADKYGRKKAAEIPAESMTPYTGTNLQYARDPQGKLHSAPAGQALPQGWTKAEAP